MINRTGNENTADVFGPGLEAINSDKISEAIQFFERIPVSAEYYPEARLYLGIAYFRNQDYQNALENAEIVLQTSERFREKAKWLKINALLISGQTGTEFESLLDEMSKNSPDNYYRSEAKQLKIKLNQVWRNLVF